VALPFVLTGIGTFWVRITNLAILFCLLALGLNIVVGFAGLLDLGYIAFYAVGAYVYALLASPHFNLHLPFWIILPIGGVVACFFGVILGAPTLKLRGDYLAIVTLGFGEIIRIFLNNLSQPVNITNGPQGVARIDPFRLGASTSRRRRASRAHVHRPDEVLLPAAARADRRHRDQPAAAGLAHRPRVGGDPRGRDRGARDGHQHAQHEAPRVRDGRVVRRHLGRHVQRDPGLHQPRELHPGREHHGARDGRAGRHGQRLGRGDRRRAAVVRARAPARVGRAGAAGGVRPHDPRSGGDPDAFVRPRARADDALPARRHPALGAAQARARAEAGAAL
jgi:hypothetical protein